MEDEKQGNILMFSLEYPPYKGGIANYYENIVSYWPENNIYVLANKSKNVASRENIYYQALISNFIFPKWLPAFWHLFKLVKNKKIKHVIVGHVLPLGTVTWLLASILGFNYTVILHGMDATQALAKKRKKRLTKKILKQSQWIICANSYTSQIIKKVASPQNDSKIHIVNPGVKKPSQSITDNQVEKIKNKYRLNNKFVLLSIGRLVARKGFQQVIKAFPQISEKTNDLIYAIAGTGSFKEQLKKQVEGLNLPMQNKIIFLGDITEEQKWIWLKICDAFIMPSMNLNGDFEGFGIVYLEANIMGKPVIAGQEGGVADSVNHNINGLIVDPRNLNTITQAVKQLTDNQEFKKNLGKQGEKRAREDFDQQKQTLKIYNIIKNNQK